MYTTPSVISFKPSSFPPSAFAHVAAYVCKYYLFVSSKALIERWFRGSSGTELEPPKEASTLNSRGKVWTCICLRLQTSIPLPKVGGPVQVQSPSRRLASGSVKRRRSHRIHLNFKPSTLGRGPNASSDPCWTTLNSFFLSTKWNTPTSFLACLARVGMSPCSSHYHDQLFTLTRAETWIPQLTTYATTESFSHHLAKFWKIR